ncbi:hypothetical protein ACFPVX_03570 [Cohnella faecalis]|uniref:Uncharacterized protein n=1 Tax=Cohnella faecalis TaxID=2315694 RepID=A0A398CUI5_9BACL|nr:hypothetical protein [Cohnella faecalis]RIE03517.1 hypothetical protein D3H35_12050 [Cohnella faecalis]
MAFGIRRQELQQWKDRVTRGEIAYLTHYWLDPRFPDSRTVTKVGCANVERLAAWCEENGLPSRYIHRRDAYPHFDLFGPKQAEVLLRAGEWEQLRRFGLLTEGKEGSEHV